MDAGEKAHASKLGSARVSETKQEEEGKKRYCDNIL